MCIAVFACIHWTAMDWIVWKKTKNTTCMTNPRNPKNQENPRNLEIVDLAWVSVGVHISQFSLLLLQTIIFASFALTLRSLWDNFGITFGIRGTW